MWGVPQVTSKNVLQTLNWLLWASVCIVQPAQPFSSLHVWSPKQIGEHTYEDKILYIAHAIRTKLDSLHTFFVLFTIVSEEEEFGFIPRWQSKHDLYQDGNLNMIFFLAFVWTSLCLVVASLYPWPPNKNSRLCYFLPASFIRSSVFNRLCLFKTRLKAGCEWKAALVFLFCS